MKLDLVMISWISLHIAPKAKTSEKINWDFKKAFSSYITDKEFISRIHKELLQPPNKKIYNPIFLISNGFELTYIQIRSEISQEAHEKMFSIINY